MLLLFTKLRLCFFYFISLTIGIFLVDRKAGMSSHGAKPSKTAMPRRCFFKEG